MEKSKFQTEVDVPDFKWKTGYSKSNLFMGSCFTENVGNKMAALKFNVDINPFGILYNPVSVANGLQILLENKQFQKKDLIEHNGLWHSFYHHGRFSGTDANATLQQINERINQSSVFLKKTNFLFLTFGTAWIYQYKKTQQPVSNCHKIPANDFERIRLTVNEITEMYLQLLSEIKKVNPELKVIFTVSPIRHWKDGASENQLSKATLLLSIDQIIQELGPEFCNYFPAYEIVMDELRDYRFYAEDMIHLSDVAVNHIWDIFQQKSMDENSKKIIQQILKIIKAVNHKPFNKYTKEYLNFLKSTLHIITELETQNPYLNFALEKEQLNVANEEIEKNIEHF